MNGARKQLLYKPVLLMIKLLLSSYIFFMSFIFIMQDKNKAHKE